MKLNVIRKNPAAIRGSELSDRTPYICVYNDLRYLIMEIDGKIEWNEITEGTPKRTEVTDAAEDNLLSFDSVGRPQDSGAVSTDVHSKLHDIDSTVDHNGVSGAVENNLIAFDANGLPKDSDYDKDQSSITYALMLRC